MDMFAPRVFALMALACFITQIADAQNAPVSSPEVEQRIQHVIAGLTGGVVIKGDEHATQTLAYRMKELSVPGVSIAVIHEGKIEWARGFGVRSLGGLPVTADTMFQGRLYQ
jgi:CubicO group peptidase (beta-lactamase class C family)